MTEHLTCPKCGQPMSKSGRVRKGKELKQRWICARIAGCGHVKLVKIEEERK